MWYLGGFYESYNILSCDVQKFLVDLCYKEAVEIGTNLAFSIRQQA